MIPASPNAPDSFAGYAAAFDGRSHFGAAYKTPALVYEHAPDAQGDMSLDLQSDGPYYGTVGVYHRPGMLVSTPAGPWTPDYMGNLPVEQQPHLPDVAPWTTEGV